MAADPASVHAARALLQSARAICVLTGAGVSAESGVPTFRGWTPADGPDAPLWAHLRPEDLATPDAFARAPDVVWAWYAWRRSRVAAAAPNAGHRALAALEARRSAFTLVTQNVDGLHARAGSRRVLALHGDLWTNRCTACGAAREERTGPAPGTLPRCPCGGLERPGVVWFGESVPADLLREAHEAASACAVFLLVGTSAVVHPAAGVAVAAMQAGRPVVEINPEDTPLSPACTLCLRGPSAEILPALVA
jgi:NAD-dependent deacetylase